MIFHKNIFTISILLFSFSTFGQKQIVKFNFDEKNGEIVNKYNSFSIPTLDNSVFYETIIEVPDQYQEEEIFRACKKLYLNFATKPSIGTTIFKLFELRGKINEIDYEDKDEKIVSGYVGFITPKEKANKDRLLTSGDIITCKLTFLIKNQRIKIFIEDVEFYYKSTARQIAAELIGGVAFGVLASYSRGSFNEMLADRLNKDHSNYQVSFIQGMQGYSIDYYIKKLPDALKSSIIQILSTPTRYSFE